jgi:hypothetical protein
MRKLLVVAGGALVLACPAGARPLAQADRAAINRVFDVFVPAAVERKNVAAAYDVVTAQFRGGVTRAEWAKGDIAVYPFQARGTRFHDWTVDYVQGNEVAFELMLQPSNPRKDSISYEGTVKKIGGRWLIDSLYPAATFAGSGGAKVVGPNDFVAQRYTGDAGESRLGSIWFVLPGAILALIVLVPIAFAIVHWRRGRSAPPTEAERERYDEFFERLRTRGSES